MRQMAWPYAHGVDEDTCVAEIPLLDDVWAGWQAA